MLEVLRRYPGSHDVLLFDETTGRQQLVPKEYYVNGSAALIEICENLLGRENVKFVKLR